MLSGQRLQVGPKTTKTWETTRSSTKEMNPSQATMKTVTMTTRDQTRELDFLGASRFLVTSSDVTVRARGLSSDHRSPS